MTYLLRLVACLFLCVSLNSFGALSIRDLDGDWSNGHEGVYDDVLDITWLADANIAESNSFGHSGNSSLSTGYDNLYSSYFGGPLFSMPSAIDYVQAVNENNGVGYLGHSNWRFPKIVPLSNGQYISGGMTFQGTYRHRYDGSSDEGFNITAPVSEYNPTGASEGEIRNELAYNYYNNFQAKAPSSGNNINGAAENRYPSSIWGLNNSEDTESVDLFINLGTYDRYWTDFYTGGNSNSWLSFKMETGQTVGSGYNNGARVWLVHDGDIGASPVPLPAGIYLFLSGLVGLVGAKLRGRNA